MDCIFCKIANKEIPTDFLYESENLVAFRDIHPIAPMHVLIIPKRHIASVNELKNDENGLAGEMILVAKEIAQKLDIAEKGYKLLIRVGNHGGQEVPHLHLHLIGGAPLYEDIHPR